MNQEFSGLMVITEREGYITKGEERALIGGDEARARAKVCWTGGGVQGLITTGKGIHNGPVSSFLIKQSTAHY